MKPSATTPGRGFWAGAIARVDGAASRGAGEDVVHQKAAR
jgi:hypothetical protein